MQFTTVIRYFLFCLLAINFSSFANTPLQESKLSSSEESSDTNSEQIYKTSFSPKEDFNPEDKNKSINIKNEGCSSLFDRTNSAVVNVGSYFSGSGFFVSSDGLIITSLFLIKDPKDIRITMQDGSKFDASLVGSDKETGIALLKIKSEKPTPFLKFSKFDDIKIGDNIIIIINGLHDGNVASSGIVSSKFYRSSNSWFLGDFIQTDASSNREGNGAPLLNSKGEVVGMLVHESERVGGNNLNVAIPSHLINKVFLGLSNGDLRRYRMGIAISYITGNINKTIGLKDVRGIFVHSVDKNSSAEKIGIKPGDVILSFNGKELGRGRGFLSYELIGLKEGCRYPITIFRDGKEMELELIPSIEKFQNSINNKEKEKKRHADIPLKVRTIDRKIRSILGLQDDVTGVMVVKINGDRLTERDLKRGRIKIGEIITKINGKKVKSSSDFYKYVSAARRNNDRSVVIELEFSDRSKYCEVVKLF